MRYGDTELRRLLRRATQGARILKDLDVVAYVAAFINRWERYGLVTPEEVKEFYDAGVECGKTLGTSFLPPVRNAAADAAKRGGGYGSGPAGAGADARSAEARAAKQRALARRSGYRAAAARSGGDGPGAPGGVHGGPDRDGDRGGEG